jgi:hypothetical protein
VEDSCEAPKTRREYISWVEQILQSIRELDVDRADLKGIWKRFYEEFLPLERLFSNSKDFSNDFTVQLFPGNQSFDAKLEFNNGPLIHIEITFSHDGHFWSHVDKHSKKFGHAPLTGSSVDELRDALECGEPGGGGAEEASTIFDEVLKRTQTDLEKKCANENYRAYSPIYLILYIEDGGLMGRYGLEDLAKKLLLPFERPFSSIYLIGNVSKKVLKLN